MQCIAKSSPLCTRVLPSSALPLKAQTQRLKRVNKNISPFCHREGIGTSIQEHPGAAERTGKS